ncbi:MAG: response regulator transcription factor [Oligoflexia bacterium]|nr:response regulator transcription factor [Oligoflexia bacterium]
MIQIHKKILIVEDEPHIAEGLTFNLELEGLLVENAYDGESAIEKWKTFVPDLIILDLMIPKIDGLKVLEIIRDSDEKIPILILSAKNQILDKVHGFSLGADDYLTKPFHLEELIQRIKSLLKKADWYLEQERIEEKEVMGKQSAANINTNTNTEDKGNEFFEFGKNKIFLNSYWAKTERGEFRLTEQEMKLLKIFFTTPNKLISRKQLLSDGWGYNDQVETRTLDIFINRLRKYFEPDPKRPIHFVNVRNSGIIFNININNPCR